MKFLVQGLLAMIIMFYLGYLVAAVPKTAPAGLYSSTTEPLFASFVELQ